jgi:hypothetical protein
MRSAKCVIIIFLMISFDSKEFSTKSKVFISFGIATAIAPSDVLLTFKQPIVEIKIATWSNWSEWSMCNTSCSSSVEFSRRTRECVIPAGVDKKTLLKSECNGPNKEIRQCDTTTMTKCENKSPNEWSEWSECSVKCGVGTRTRIRKCSKLKNDFPCEGSELIMERSVCNVSCAIRSDHLSQWSDWSDWSVCSVSCGTGVSTRRRVCLAGSDCPPGQASETKTCVNNTGCQMVERKQPSQSEASAPPPPPKDNCKNSPCTAYAKSTWIVVLSPSGFFLFKFGITQ